jgi:4-amino-4-deoxy-L-arabinose transferase-like glycosyltransferase
MAKKHKYNKKMVAKLPETSNLDPNFTPQTLSDISISTLFRSKYLQLLLVITAIGCFLRFYNLGFNSLWLDEASTLTFATAGSFWDIWTLTVTIEPNPPLFHWIEYIMLSFGNSEFVLRFAPAVIGTLTIPVIYFIGKEFIDENGGLISAAAFAISPFLILYSQEARAYSLLLFFIALSTLFYLYALKSSGYKWWIAFALASSLAFWTHFYTVIFLAALIIYTLAIYKLKYIKELIISGIILAISVLPLGIISIPVLLASKSGGPTFGVQGFAVIQETLVQLLGFNILSAMILITLFLIGLTTLFIKEKENGILLIWILAFTFIASIVLSFKIPMVPRYLIFLDIVLVLGIAYSYKLFYSLSQNKIIIYAMIFIIAILSAPFLMSYYSGYSKDDWRGFSKTLSSTTQPGDSIVIVPGYMYQPLNYYYSNATDGTTEYLASNEAELASARALQTKTSYYIVTGDIMSANPNGDALRWIQNNTQQVYQSSNIFVFKS